MPPASSPMRCSPGAHKISSGRAKAVSCRLVTYTPEGGLGTSPIFAPDVAHVAPEHRPLPAGSVGDVERAHRQEGWAGLPKTKTCAMGSVAAQNG